jgi:hypothetical protein
VKRATEHADGVYATCWAVRRGCGRFDQAFLTAVLELDRENEYVLFVDSDSEEFPLPQERPRIARVVCGEPSFKADARPGVWASSRATGREIFDLVFISSVYSWVPITSGVPRIVTVHDVLSGLHPERVFPTLRSKRFWRAKVGLVCAQARVMWTVCKYSRRGLPSARAFAWET